MFVQCIVFLFTFKLVCKPFEGHFKPLNNNTCQTKKVMTFFYRHSTFISPAILLLLAPSSFLLKQQKLLTVKQLYEIGPSTH